MIKVAFIFKSQRTEKTKFFCQGTDSSINPRYESLITVYYKYEEILLFAFLDLWLKEDDYQILIFKFIHSTSGSIDFFQL